MRNPVVTTDGIAYERHAIAQWLEHNDSSPVTGVVLESKALTPVHALRAIAEMAAGTMLPQGATVDLHTAPAEAHDVCGRRRLVTARHRAQRVSRENSHPPMRRRARMAYAARMANAAWRVQQAAPPEPSPVRLADDYPSLKMRYQVMSLFGLPEDGSEHARGALHPTVQPFGGLAGNTSARRSALAWGAQPRQPSPTTGGPGRVGLDCHRYTCLCEAGAAAGHAGLTTPSRDRGPASRRSYPYP